EFLPYVAARAVQQLVGLSPGVGDDLLAYAFAGRAPFRDEFLYAGAGLVELLLMLFTRHPRGLAVLLRGRQEVPDLLLTRLDGAEERRERRRPAHHEDDEERQGRPDHQTAAPRRQPALLGRQRGDRSDHKKRREPQRFRGHVSDRKRDQWIFPE